jgi:hypothetical protein
MRDHMPRRNGLRKVMLASGALMLQLRRFLCADQFFSRCRALCCDEALELDEFIAGFLLRFGYGRSGFDAANFAFR